MSHFKKKSLKGWIWTKALSNFNEEVLHKHGHVAIVLGARKGMGTEKRCSLRKFVMKKVKVTIEELCQKKSR